MCVPAIPFTLAQIAYSLLGLALEDEGYMGCIQLALLSSMQ